ncbi:MAG: hypothetical protein NVSMB1_07940 [Polyangiales bacterium]
MFARITDIACIGLIGLIDVTERICGAGIPMHRSVGFGDIGPPFRFTGVAGTLATHKQCAAKEDQFGILHEVATAHAAWLAP